jgi:hypothetical protein
MPTSGSRDAGMHAIAYYTVATEATLKSPQVVTILGADYPRAFAQRQASCFATL